MPHTALILLAHGARDPDWAAPVYRVQAAVRGQRPDLRVDVAFLEFMAPGLRESVQSVVSDGCTRVVVLPMFIAQGGHIKRELPLLLDELRILHAGVRFELALAVGEAESVVQAIAAHARGVA